MTIEICTVCTNFQRRWVMQLSSLVQQIDPPDFIINVAYVKGIGSPDIETIVKFYEQKGLKFKLTPYDEELKTRGLIRNIQVKNSTEEWLFFNDSDLIYDPYFLKGMKNYLDPKFQGVIGFPLTAHTKLKNANEFFDCFKMYIDSAYDVAKSFGITKVYKRKVPNGGAQLVRKKVILDKGKGFYVRPDYYGDKPMGFMGTRSDKRFRNRIGERKLVFDLSAVIHIEHYRIIDKEFNINMQR